MRTKFIVISILCIIAGFSLIHAGKPLIEYIGSGLIGAGSLYLIFQLIKAERSSKTKH